MQRWMKIWVSAVGEGQGCAWVREERPHVPHSMGFLLQCSYQNS